MRATELEPGLQIAGLTLPLRLHDFKLIAFDMDSTLINIECVDEIADAVGKKAEVAAITEAAMRGEITDYKASLRQRVALLKGVTLVQIDQLYRERLRLNPGATELVAACKLAGLKVLLVSGGFTHFTDRVRDQLGIDFTRSNQLEVQDGALTGRMVDQAWGDICEPREVLHLGRVHQGAAGGDCAFDQHWFELRPRRIDGRGVAGRTGADDDQVTHAAGHGSPLLGSG